MTNAAHSDDDLVDVPDDVLAQVTNYVDDKLTGADRADVETKIRSGERADRAWAQAYEEAVIIKVTDYVDGTLKGAERTAVETRIQSGKPEDAIWKQTHDDMTEASKVISGMRPPKPKAPEQFVEHVTETIHKRSAGRFFARRTLGDRVPFGVLLIVALLALGVVGYLLWSSPTGSLKVDKPREVPKHRPLDIERP